ncbi:MAG: hypothetical protein HWN67_14510 [Candidatus Helarchaeota archaeon]|nr:hypothetical protein [Candidatus Helarchaeota archaeon]
MNAINVKFFHFSTRPRSLNIFLEIKYLMIIHHSRKTVRTGSKITCESWQRTVGCCPTSSKWWSWGVRISFL